MKASYFGFGMILAFAICVPVGNSFAQISNPDFIINVTSDKNYILLNSSKAARPRNRESIIRICAALIGEKHGFAANISGAQPISDSQPRPQNKSAFNDERCGLFLTTTSGTVAVQCPQCNESKGYVFGIRILK